MSFFKIYLDKNIFPDFKFWCISDIYLCLYMFIYKKMACYKKHASSNKRLKNYFYIYYIIKYFICQYEKIAFVVIVV